MRVLSRILYSIFSKILGGLSPDLQNLLLAAMVRTFRESTDTVASVMYRPKFKTGYALSGESYELAGRKIVVILQGPIATQDRYTYETILMYRNNPDLYAIILSTWDTEIPSEIQNIRQLGVEVVLSPVPPIRGMWNVNLQIASTMAGLRRAAEMGATHVLKSRTDQRLYRSNFGTALLALVDLFPCKPELNQFQRIVVSSLNSYVYRPYSLSDMLVFGSLEDMLRCWDLPINNENRANSTYSGISMERLLEFKNPEMLIIENFMKSLGRPILNTLEDYHDIVQDHYIVVDQELLDQAWMKRITHQEFPDKFYDHQSSCENWSFSRWLIDYRFRPNGQKVPCNLKATVLDGPVVC